MTSRSRDALRPVLVLLALAGLPAAVSADGLDPKVRAYLDTHCVSCHGKDVAKSDFRVDTLSPKVGVENTPQWLEVIERINSGEMPPKTAKSRPTADESGRVVEWLSARMKEGE